MNFSAADQCFMQRALVLAGRGLYSTTPNPRVGCVLVQGDEIVGEGWHVRAGEPHAEVHALAAAGSKARGATAYVTLEPCAHHGRTPPCAEALIAAGVRRVVAALTDPNPQVAGRGMAMLRAAGIATAEGLLAAEARELNIGFISRMTRGRPWLRLKIAASLDGRTALKNGQSQWITGAAARQDGHRWRARACALLTGIGTVAGDDPQLNVREVETERQPLKIVLDSHLELSPDARLFADAASVLVVSALDDKIKAQPLLDKGAEWIALPDAAGRIDLAQLLPELGRRGLNEVHAEAGATLNGAFIAAGLADELLLYLAPCLLGDAARPLAVLPELENLAGRWAFEMQGCERIGEAVRIRCRKPETPA
ncbi:MAG: bifunctional diaminohydroxyphosphoribosylaminopyrimidine deaminase/5-amino-6-(5-phosphoribosylamino)uracil reductase RibD [Zoogloeaceae bacterium]|nr:bifunctional diaminohydroxyphosphoribosylaminopyrimidine deaminase/5-amino-6-(5-phosphoribosylamino)uracil reductase RibD [Zoogloeaceae bacterium]